MYYVCKKCWQVAIRITRQLSVLSSARIYHKISRTKLLSKVKQLADSCILLTVMLPFINLHTIRL